MIDSQDKAFKRVLRKRGVVRGQGEVQVFFGNRLMAPAVPKGWGETKLGSWSPVNETRADTALLDLLFSRTPIITLQSSCILTNSNKMCAGSRIKRSRLYTHHF